MTNSDLKALLDRISDLLGERALTCRVNEAIDAALATFVIRYDHPLSPRQALRIWGGFLMSAYDRLGGGCRLFDPNTAEEYAVDLAEQNYVGKFGSGYHAAVRDSIESPPESIAPVLAQFARAIKRMERAKLIRSALDAIVDPTDRKLRAALARMAMERVAELTGHRPPQLTDGEIAASYRFVVSYFVRVHCEGSEQDAD